MNDLAARKQLLIAQADLHRQLLALECSQLRGRWEKTSSFVEQNRWWLVGGAAIAGVLSVRHWRGLAQWLPALVTMWRALKN